MENYLNNTSILKIILKWKIHLIVIIVASIGLSIFFSCPWFITPKYKSTTIMYPVNLDAYSDETLSEQMIQVFKSEDIMDSLIKKFRLAEHYKIDSHQKYFHSLLKKEFETNVSISKTEYESVCVEIKDASPKLACDMVNAMTYFFNIKVKTMLRNKYEEVLILMENQLNGKKKQIDSIERKLTDLKIKYEILDYNSQTKELFRNYYKSNNNVQTWNLALSNLKEKGGEFCLLNDAFYRELEAYKKIKLDYEIAVVNMNKELTYTNIVTSPVVADKKIYPVRWLIVFTSVISTLFFSFIIICAIENARAKKKLINSLN